MTEPEQKALFDPGRIAVMPEAASATTKDRRYECLIRHVTGDFGDTHPDDAQLNHNAIACGGRIMSAYAIEPAKPVTRANTFWIITETRRGETYILLPSEY